MTAQGLTVLLQFGLGETAWSLIGVIIGLIGGFGSSIAFYWYQQRVRRKTIRKALRRELELPKDVIERATETDASSFTGPFHGEIPTTVYESQAAEIGLLSDDELDALIAYYATAAVARNQLQSLDDEAVAERFFDETAPILKRNRKNAVEALSRHT